MTNQKNVGWVRPEAVTHQTEPVRVASLGEVTVPKIDQGGPVGKGEFVYVDISSVDNKLKRITDPKRLAVAVAPSRAKQRLKAGDVLVSMTRPNLNAVAIVPQELDNAIGSTGFHVLRATDGTEPRWLYNAVQTHHFISAMSELVQGALYPAVRPKDIRAFEIPVPPLDQQKRIVAEIEKQFSRLDEAVANLKRVKANLKRYKAAVLKAAVEGRLVETEAELARREGRSYETGAQLLQRILETRRSQWKGKGKYKEPAAPDTTDLPELPEGWVWASLEMVSEAIGGFAFSSKKFSSSGDQVVKMANVRMGHIDLMQRPSFVSDVDDEIQQKYGLCDGDILVTLTGTRRERDYGYVAVVRNPRALLLNQRIARLRPAPGIDSDFLALTLQSESYRNRFFARETGNVGQGNVGMAAVTIEAVSVAPQAEKIRVVAEIDRRLSLLRETEAQIYANLQRAERLRQSTLASAFSGKLLLGESGQGARTLQAQVYTG